MKFRVLILCLIVARQVQWGSEARPTTSVDFGEDAPSGLVFINSCQTGRSGEGIAGGAGLANSFIRPIAERGAAAFIGALWSVSDDLALSFVDMIYDESAPGGAVGRGH
jgi:CHAT domain-containing protein